MCLFVKLLISWIQSTRTLLQQLALVTLFFKITSCIYLFSAFSAFLTVAWESHVSHETLNCCPIMFTGKTHIAVHFSRGEQKIKGWYKYFLKPRITPVTCNSMQILTYFQWQHFDNYHLITSPWLFIFLQKCHSTCLA